MDKNKIFYLFSTFFKIGLFTFGGGYAMISLIEDECVERKQWLTVDELSSVVAIAESTPGPIAINCATYVGYMQEGFFGAVIATLGMVLPSFIVILTISLFFDRFLEYPIISNAFKGIKIAVGILIMQAGIKMLKKSNHKQSYIFIFFSFLTMIFINIFSLRISTIYLLLIFGCISMSIYYINNKGDKV